MIPTSYTSGQPLERIFLFCSLIYIYIWRYMVHNAVLIAVSFGDKCRTRRCPLIYKLYRQMLLVYSTNSSSIFIELFFVIWKTDSSHNPKIYFVIFLSMIHEQIKIYSCQKTLVTLIAQPVM